MIWCHQRDFPSLAKVLLASVRAAFLGTWALCTLPFDAAHMGLLGPKDGRPSFDCASLILDDNSLLGSPLTCDLYLVVTLIPGNLLPRCITCTGNGNRRATMNKYIRQVPALCSIVVHEGQWD